VLAAAGFAINAAVAFERQLAQMFFPLLSLATVVRNNPYYPKFNTSFDAVAKELMEEVRLLTDSSRQPVAAGAACLVTPRQYQGRCCDFAAGVAMLLTSTAAAGSAARGEHPKRR
jgi:hypothetical protein